MASRGRDKCPGVYVISLYLLVAAKLAKRAGGRPVMLKALSCVVKLPSGASAADNGG